MKIEYLRCFKSIEKYKSFSKAAENLYITQSALSKKIKALELELGDDLFIRNGNSAVELSSFGRYISNSIDNILEDYEILLKESRDYNAHYRKKVKVGAFLNIAHSGMITPMTEFEMGQDRIQLEIIERDHNRLKQTMSMEKIDVCFGYSELLGDIEGYEQIPLYKDPLLLIASNDFKNIHGWGDTIKLKDLKNIPLLFPREDMELFTFLINLCKEADVVPQYTNSDIRLGTIREYIATSMRCTMQFSSISRSKFYEDMFVFLKVKEAPVLTMTMYRENKLQKKGTMSFTNYFLNYFKDKYEMLADR